MVKITERKAYNQFRDQRRAKRGGGRLRGESVLGSGEASQERAGMDQIIGNEPTPAFAAMLAEALDGLLGGLTPELKTIALLKLEGHTNEEIAAKTGRSVPTVERRLRLIRSTWQEDPP